LLQLPRGRLLWAARLCAAVAAGEKQQRNGESESDAFHIQAGRALEGISGKDAVHAVRITIRARPAALLPLPS
jgi:hypothetical protein